MNLFSKYFGKCFVGGMSNKLTPTMGLNFFLFRNATGNAACRHIAQSSRPIFTMNKSRYMRF